MEYKAEIGLALAIGEYNMPLKSTEYNLDYIKTYITDSKIVKNIKIRKKKATDIVNLGFNSVFS